MLLVTAPEGPAAEALARTLVGEGLAACVNRMPGVRSGSAVAPEWCSSP